MSGNCMIIDFVRTPLCAMGKGLMTRPVDQIEFAAMNTIMKRQPIDPEKLDHTICGHAHLDTDPYNLSKHAWLLTRLSENVPGYTVHAGEASGLMALEKAYYLHRTGNDLTALVGGAESYSRAPYILREARYRMDLNQFPVVDSITEGEQWTQPTPLDPRDLARELAEKKGYTQEQLDAKVREEKEKLPADLWEGHIAPVTWLDRKKKEVTVTADELPEPENGFASYVDGGVVMMTAEEDRAKELGLKPIGQIRGFAWAATEPENRWESAVLAVKKLLAKHSDVKPEEIGDVEILADSAASTLAIEEGLGELGLKAEVMNPSGGSLAWGVNEGGDGVMAACRILLALPKSGKKYGLVTASSGGGQSMAMLMEVF